MELITTPRRDFSIQGADAQSVEIRRKYGGSEEFISRFNVNRQEYCALNIERALAVKTPSLVQFGKAYGEMAVLSLLTAHTANVIASLSEYEKFGVGEMQNLAKAIWMNPKARILSLPSVIAFFFYLKLGYFKLYSGGVRNILEAFNDYLDSAIDKEQQIKRELEKEARIKEREIAAQNCVPVDENKFRALLASLTCVKKPA